MRKRTRAFRRPSYIVIGTSAGGGAALARIFKDLPEDFPGAILIVMHVSPASDIEWLRQQLTRVGRIPVEVAEARGKIFQGTAYIAPAGTHMLVEGSRISLGTGPVEQHVRPAIDVLFRSVAKAHGRRVVGVILTGMLKDGTVGLRAVRDAGGITIVQNPIQAEAGEMPWNAMQDLNVDYCLELSEIGPVLDLLVRRAGSHKQGVLETGLATSVRLMRQRVRLLAKLFDQSRENPRTAHFLQDEISALERDIDRIRRQIPAVQASSGHLAGSRKAAPKNFPRAQEK